MAEISVPKRIVFVLVSQGAFARRRPGEECPARKKEERRSHSSRSNSPSTTSMVRAWVMIAVCIGIMADCCGRAFFSR